MIISAEQKDTNSIESTQITEKENISSNIPSQNDSQDSKVEKCTEHTWKPVYFYCSCGKFLCMLCLKTHCHSNMNFCDIKTFYSNVLKEMEQILTLIDKYTPILKSVEGNSNINSKLDSIMYTKKSLVNLLSHKEILFSLSLTQLKEVKDNNLFYKISNSISDYLEGAIKSNEEKIQNLIHE